MKTCDQSLPKSEHGMSNCYLTIDEGMEKDLRNGMRSEHCAWHFYGLVWFEDNQFHEEVKQYHRHIATRSADILKELMELVNSEFGYE